MEIDEIRQELPTKLGEDEEFFQKKVADLMGVGTFFDVLIILRFLVFMLEDRRALVWDPSAQRQIFRVLMLPPDRAGEYAAAQQSVISADSAVRNTRALITRHQKQRVIASKRASAAAAAEAQRRIKSSEADALRDKMTIAADERADADSARNSARLDRLRSAEAKDSATRELERIKMEALKHWLGPSQDTVRYIIGHLLSDGRCLVCNSTESAAADQITERLRSGLCPICGGQHEVDQEVIPLSAVDSARIVRLEDEIALAEKQLAEAEVRLKVAQIRLDAAAAEYQVLETSRIRVDRELLAILRSIPNDRAALGTAQDEVDVLERIIKEDMETQRSAELRFGAVVAEAVLRVQNMQHEIASSFTTYLQLFLREDAELVYQTIRARVGQAGAVFDFPSFKLSMSGGAVAGQTIRDEPNAVSQSQAEFVDLAFRMALMSVASDKSGSTLVVDAPEASLDFLFARRAGLQLAAFSSAHQNNRVIITSYLPSANLVAAILSDSNDEEDRRARIVDLIKNAAPNAALRADREEYEAFLEKVLVGADVDAE
jgi:hypothetical protein